MELKSLPGTFIKVVFLLIFELKNPNLTLLFPQRISSAGIQGFCNTHSRGAGFHVCGSISNHDHFLEMELFFQMSNDLSFPP